MEDETIFTKKPQSTIFSTSVRGWIALLLSAALSVSILLIVLASFIEVPIPDPVSSQLLALFSAGFGSAVTQYFNQISREGQKK